MRKFFLSVLTAGALLGAAIASQAQTLTYELLADTTWTTVGVGGTDPAGDPSIINFFAPLPAANPQLLPTPTGFNFADDLTLPGMGTPGSFTNFGAVPVDFNFTITDGAIVDTYHVAGVINGRVGYDANGVSFTNANVTFNTITDSLGNAGAIDPGGVPQTGNPGFKIVSVLGNDTVTLWLQQSYQKPRPGDHFLPQGFITATTSAVPEPGTVALLASSCMCGSVFLLRRRMRRA